MRLTKILGLATMGALLCGMGCGGGAAAPATTPPPTAAVSVSVSASPASVGLSQTSQITATVTNDVNSAGVTFALASGAPGTLATVDPLHATYTSPASLSAAASVTITATSVADTTKSASVNVSVNPAVSVSVAASSSTALAPLQATLITATTTNDGGAGVTWSLSSGAVGTLTTIDALHASYTAPAILAQSGSDTVTATSKADGTKTASTAVAYAAPTPNPGIDPTIDNTGVWQNLVQFYADLNRGGSTVPPYAAMELSANLQPTNPNANSNVYQSDLMIFHDTQTGAEVWRMDDDPTSETAMAGTLNRQPWDANGSHIEVWSSRQVIGNNGPYGGNNRNFIFNANASQVSLVQPTDPTRIGYMQYQLGFASGQYLPWDPITPGIFYIATYDDTEQVPPAPNPNASLYSVEANDSNFTMTKMVDLPNPAVTKQIQSYLANDGMIMVRDANGTCPGGNEGTPNDPCTTPLASNPTIPAIYMTPSNKADPAYGTIKYQYPIDFNLTQYTAFGHTVDDEFHIHDIYFRRDSGDDDFIFNYGPGGDVGEGLFFEVPVDGNPAHVQVATSGVGGGDINAGPGGASPLGTLIPPLTVGSTPYYSHPAFNYNGTLVAYSGEQTFNNNIGPYGAWVRNQTTGQTLGQFGPNFGHVAWDGFDPNYIVFDVQGTTPNAAGYDTYGEYSSNPASPVAYPATPPAQLVVHDQLRCDPKTNCTSYSLDEGPGQSPDATKFMFTLPETWAVGANRKLFIAVDHRPIPPTLAASGGGSSVTLTWTPYFTHREIAGYHVYRSPQGAAAFQEISNGLVAGNCSTTADCTFTDSSVTAGQVYDYAVTAQENSGLESNKLSNVEEVTVGGSVTPQQGAGLTGWWKTPPAPPSSLQATEDPSGKFLTLSWTASTSSDVRYYKIYYGDGAPPAVDPNNPMASQAYLIATPPVGVTQWIIWQVDPNVPPVFKVSAVDRQDNESSAVCLETANPTASCQ